jgi:hypothetical protein
MSDGIRRIVAILVLVAGAALLWVTGNSSHSAEAANNEIRATVSANQELAAASDPRLKQAVRFEQGGWVYVHLEGDPDTIGFQHGFLLAPEIEDAFPAVSANMMHNTQREWAFFRQTAREMLWPKIDPEYQQELRGIAEGLHARTGSKLDVFDIVALNSFEEVPDYYVPWLNKQEKLAHAPNLKSPGNCSAFVATGSWTKDGQIVMAHNNWTNYMNGERWRIIFDIKPEHGFRVLMDGFPGVIASDDDFGINSNGMMATETTISQFEGWDPKGKPEFMRARKALQYAGSIDEYSKIMLDGRMGCLPDPTGRAILKSSSRTRRSSTRIIKRLHRMPGGLAGNNCWTCIAEKSMWRSHNRCLAITWTLLKTGRMRTSAFCAATSMPRNGA